MLKPRMKPALLVTYDKERVVSRGVIAVDSRWTPEHGPYHDYVPVTVGSNQAVFPLFDHELFFSRVESDRVDCVALVQFLSEDEQGLRSLQKAVTGWVDNTEHGHATYVDSVQDLNIGDLVVADLKDDDLAAWGVYALRIQVLQAVEQQHSYDLHLYTGECVEKEEDTLPAMVSQLSRFVPKPWAYAPSFRVPTIVLREDEVSARGLSWDFPSTMWHNHGFLHPTEGGGFSVDFSEIHSELIDLCYKDGDRWEIDYGIRPRPMLFDGKYLGWRPYHPMRGCRWTLATYEQRFASQILPGPTRANQESTDD